MAARFPDGFTWGAATSAYQIEGGREDGKGESIWDRFSAESRLRDPGDVACDHYHRWPEDVDLLADLGVTAYRFSIAWTRILPDGTGAVNGAGLGFYDRLVDALLDRGITPWITLYHWDLPQALQDRGGWPERSTVDAFLRYTEVVSRTLGDRVRHWITQNEPWVAAFLGHLAGVFAPGQTSWAATLAAGHHLLLAHGRGTEVLREHVEGARVGIALDCRPSEPASDDPADVAADRHFDGFRNRWFFDPVFGRGYPADTVATYRERGRLPAEGDPPWLRPGDLDAIAAPLDFLGLNYYTAVRVAAGADEADDPEGPVGPGAPPGFTEMGWRSTPGALTAFLERLHRDYAPPSIAITENGASYGDGPDAGGVIHDGPRITYLEEHIAAVGDAIAAGVPVEGYFVWSLLDNLEWVAGFSQRFGLIWVDHTTQQRIPKASARWYAEVARSNGSTS
jgi:beta-glucosidase